VISTNFPASGERRTEQVWAARPTRRAASCP